MSAFVRKEIKGTKNRRHDFGMIGGMRNATHRPHATHMSVVVKTERKELLFTTGFGP